MYDWMEETVEEVPQMEARSEGSLGWVLMAERRQAGGLAAARAVMERRRERARVVGRRDFMVAVEDGVVLWWGLKRW